MFCVECKKIIKEGSKYCKYCGASQESIIEEPESVIRRFSMDDYKNQAKRRRISGKFVGIFVGILCVFIVGVLYVMSNYHECDWCDRQYVGAAYYDAWSQKDTLCEDCAKQYYSGFDYTRYPIR